MWSRAKIVAVLSLSVIANCAASNAHACSVGATAFSHEMMVPGAVEFCRHYLTSDVSYVESETGKYRIILENRTKNLWTSARGFDPDGRSITRPKFELFNDYDFVIRRKALNPPVFESDHCGYSVHMYRGFLEKEGVRYCHIAYGSGVEPFSKKTRLPKLDFTDYVLTNAFSEHVRGEFGETEITRTDYCHRSGEHRLTTIWVFPPDIDLDEDTTDYAKMGRAKAVSRPVQHIRLESGGCEP